MAAFKAEIRNRLLLFHSYLVQQAPLKLGFLNVQTSLNLFYGYFKESISDLVLAFSWGDLKKCSNDPTPAFSLFIRFFFKSNNYPFIQIGPYFLVKTIQ